jgi:glutamate--cysteine ligase catalytic subunit
MGFLTDGKTLDWPDAQKHIRYIKEHGIIQFLNTFKKFKDRQDNVLLWGDEIEYFLVEFDDMNKKVLLSLRGTSVLDQLENLLKQDLSLKQQVAWRPEYGAHMIEGTPGRPFNCREFALIEDNMKLRRQLIKSRLRSNEEVLTMVNFPLLGVGQFTSPPSFPNGPIAQSLFTSDEIINPHPRFGTLTQNIRKRRGSNVAINIPLFIDTNTVPMTNEEFRALGRPALPNHIYMDSMAFGMGQCCLQCTFQCVNITEARNFYDQLTVLSPIMLALTAGAPIFRGYLADIDVRWNVISQSVDDRTPEERGEVPLKESKYVLKKSRYGPVDMYISPSLDIQYNDVDVPYDDTYYQQLVENGVDDILAKHIAHLFVRDPLVIYENKIFIDDETHTDHFENIQSTVWQTVRFKPPPPNTPSIGWRVEFRPMEVQFTDFENAAFATFVVLLTRVISSFNINLYIPISKTEENMERAHKRNAVLTERFFFRTNITSSAAIKEMVNNTNVTVTNDYVESPNCGHQPFIAPNNSRYETAEYALLSINEIMNGKEDKSFPGLIPLCHAYLDKINMDVATRQVLNNYLKLISFRASGRLLTAASWIRQFVLQHPEYKHDSVVNDTIAYDLLKAISQISQGERKEPSLLGDFLISPTPTGRSNHQLECY